MVFYVICILLPTSTYRKPVFNIQDSCANQSTYRSTRSTISTTTTCWTLLTLLQNNNKILLIFVFFGYFIVSRTHVVASCSQQLTTMLCHTLPTTLVINNCSRSTIIVQSFTSIYKLVTSTVVVSCSNSIVITIVLCQHRATVHRTILINNIVNSSSVVEP